ncbi:hypothetical protein FQN54_007376 [Arachnomyces sp. PD_36]|nr:hypothetical protein FQN54_007376 [Arachnomyces sp. PD_36]
MSSHVVVIDSAARRAVVKVTPTKHLSDILAEACTKLNLNPSQYSLKHNNKQVDLSLSIRLSGLSSGAKLELVQLSRSPSVVSVALQLPESEAQGAPNGRLMDKFPSTTTLWLVLRKFEAGVAGNAAKRNLTARGVPSTDNGSSGAGRLYYQTPVVQVMGRELSSLTDLQKSLGQLGFNSGSALLRLSFRTTEQPLEEAMEGIDSYFKSVDDEQGTTGGIATPAPNEDTPMSEAEPSATPQSSSVETPSMEPEQPPEQSHPPEQATTETPTVSLSDDPSQARPVTIYAPPSSTTPQSAQVPYNENDYIPTIAHAKTHQRRLNESSRPVRLPTDAEIAAQESSNQEKLAGIHEVEVKFRFPDQSQIVSKFGQEDTTQTLYGFVRSCLEPSIAGEKFALSSATANRGQTTIVDTDQKYLIRDLGMKGRVLVNFSWDAGAALKARTSGAQVLKTELRSQAKDIKVQEPAYVATEEDNTIEERKPPEKKGGGKGVPKWLKLPGKK